MDSVSTDLAHLLSSLRLEALAPAFAEEAITDVALLTSMGREMLLENLDEIGIETSDATTLADALFPPSPAPAAAPATPAAAPAPSNGHIVDASPGGDASGGGGGGGAAVSAEEESAHEVAQWLLKPYLVIDPGELKSKVLRLTREANRHLHAGLHANAAATYTQALALEPPNARAVAALYYNRSAAHRALGRHWEAARDARLAAQAEPRAEPRRTAAAWWRAADAALASGDGEGAAEAVALGLKADPSSAPLKQLQAKMRADAAGL